MERLSRRAALRLTGRIGLATGLAAWVAAARTGFMAPGASAAPGRQGARVSFEVLHPWSGDNGGARSMAALARRYRELRPDVEVRQTVAPGGDYERRQVAAFASGRVPDLTLTFAEMLPAYADRGGLLALDDRIARDAIAPSDYFDVVVAQSSWGGRLYGLTHHPDLRALVYRSEPLLAGAGLDAGQEPATWSALREAAARATRRDGARLSVAGWLPTWTEPPWALFYALANGAAPLDAEGARAALDSPAVVEAIEYVVAATDQVVGGFDPIVDFAARQPGPGQETAYAVGALAFATGASWYLDRFAAEGGEVGRRTRLSLMPGGPSSPWERISLAGGVVQTIPRGARGADAAWEYLAWVAGPEGQRLIQSVSHDIAGLRSAARDPAAVASHLFRAELVDALERTHAPAHLPTPVWPSLRAELERVQHLALVKQLTPAQAAAELQARAQRLLDSQRSTGRTLYGPPPAATEPPAGPAPDATNLLRNPSFEGGSYRAGISSSVASDWSRWFQHRGADDPGYWLPEPEFGVLVGRAGQARRGLRSHRWFNSWAVHNAGVFQTVAVQPGAWLRFSAHLLGWSSQADEFARSEGPHFRWVGIDPDGGTDPFDPRIVWSSAEQTMDRWAPLSVVAQARRDRVTVFVRSQADWATKHNDVLLDDAELVVVAAPTDPAVASALAAGAVDSSAVPDPAAVAAAVDVTNGPASGSLPGSSAGSHAYFAFEYPGGETLRRIAVQASPDAPAALARVGFRVYGPRAGEVYVMSGVRVGEQPNVVGVLAAGEAGRYLIDLYNYGPGGQVDYRVGLLNK
jgi:multiple sugar transport system substrate-binding protein